MEYKGHEIFEREFTEEEIKLIDLAEGLRKSGSPHTHLWEEAERALSSRSLPYVHEVLALIESSKPSDVTGTSKE